MLDRQGTVYAWGGYHNKPTKIDFQGKIDRVYADIITIYGASNGTLYSYDFDAYVPDGEYVLNYKTLPFKTN